MVMGRLQVGEKSMIEASYHVDLDQGWALLGCTPPPMMRLGCERDFDIDVLPRRQTNIHTLLVQLH